MDYEKKYKELVGKIGKAYLFAQTNSTKAVLEEIYPELKESKESEDERIRKLLLENFKSLSNACTKNNCYRDDITYKDVVAWLEKQGKNSVRWNENIDGNKPQKNHSVLMKTTHGITEGEWNGDDSWIQYRWSSSIKNSDVLFWIELSDLENHDSQILANSAKTCKDEQKPVDKVKPKFKVGDFLVSDYCMGKVVELTNDAYLLDTEQGIPFSCEHNAHLWTIKDAKDGDVLATGNKNIFIFKSISGCTIYDYCGLYFGNFMEFTATVNGHAAVQLPMDYVPATKEQRETLEKAMANAGYTFDFEKKELKKIEQKKTPIEGEFPYDNPSDTLEGEIENIWGKLNSGGRFSATKEGFREVITHFVNYIKEQDDRELAEQKYVWSEEDEKKRNLLIAILNVNHPNGCFKVNPIYTTDMEAMSKDELVSWLKSLGPQKQWKPSDKLIRVIEAIINNRLFQRKHLDLLYADLKKLKE